LALFKHGYLETHRKDIKKTSVEREDPWSCKLYMPQYRGMPGPGSGSGWVGDQWEREGIGDFQRGN
jgi:hypothetical protein